MAVAKVIFNGNTLMDATTATASASDIASPKTAMLADGVMTTGTGTGGSSSNVSWEIVHQGTYTITDEGDTGYIATNCTPFDPIENGSVWRITWNEVQYECTATNVAQPISPDFAIGYGIGNLSAFDGTGGNNEPFAMACFDFWGDQTLTFLTLADSGNVTLIVEKQITTSPSPSVLATWETLYTAIRGIEDWGDAPWYYIQVADFFENNEDFSLGDVYRITWNGAQYICTVQEQINPFNAGNRYCVGNATIGEGTTGNNEPFVAVGWSENLMFITEQTSSTPAFTLTIEKQVPVASGLEYETGTWTPVSDVSRPTISFANSHSTPPFVVVMSDITDTADSSTTYTQYAFSFVEWEEGLGGSIKSGSNQRYGAYVAVRRVTGSSAPSGTNNVFSEGFDSQSDTLATQARHWVNEDAFYPDDNNDETMWRTGRTYKWIAVWAPST